MMKMENILCITNLIRIYLRLSFVFFFFLINPAPPEISTLPLPDALPIWISLAHAHVGERLPPRGIRDRVDGPRCEVITGGGPDRRCDPHVELAPRSYPHAIAKVDRREHRGKLVIAVRAPAEDLEREIQLRGRHQNDGSAPCWVRRIACASATHSSSDSVSGRRSGAMPAAVSTAVARSRSSPAS